MAENPFKDLESSEKAPESLKRALVSEIDTIRNTSIIIDLFVGNFYSTRVFSCDWIKKRKS